MRPLTEYYLIIGHNGTQVPIIYSHTDYVKNGELYDFLVNKLKSPYILITGQSDYSVPLENGKAIANDPNLIK